MPGALDPAHVLALAGAFSSAVAAVLIRHGLRSGSAYAGYWLNLAVGAACLWATVLLTGSSGPIDPRGVAVFALAGLVGTVAGRLLRFVSIERVGASVTAALNNLYPFISTALAILLLGERLTLAIAVGTVVIVLGTVLLSASGQRVGFAPRDLAYPILSAACFGVVAVLRKVGLGQMGAVEGFVVNVTTALVAFTAFLLVSGRRYALTADRRALGYFAVAGVAENAGVFLGLLALKGGTVAAVTPLAGTAPVFALLLSYLFLRGVETLTGLLVLGTACIVLGVYLITAL
jgi:drug/metabolite transporter (DMT)-like permease